MVCKCFRPHDQGRKELLKPANLLSLAYRNFCFCFDFQSKLNHEFLCITEDVIVHSLRRTVLIELDRLIYLPLCAVNDLNNDRLTVNFVQRRAKDESCFSGKLIVKHAASHKPGIVKL